MTSQVTDVLEAVQSFIAKGYDREYRVKDGNLVDLELGSTLDACSIRVDAALRLESGDDGEDASNIYAITDPATEHKGLLIDAFDVFHEICPRDLSERLVAHRETAPAGDQDAPSKHGLRKVGTVAKLAMRQPFVLFKGLTFQKLCLPGAFRPGDHHNKMLRPGLCVVHASPQYL
ncbi:hypothetical protein [Citrobacter sp. Cf120]|uniref:hypothetical protein n=1 Tax=Citrobacter sp. Cf120 TaxID=2985070 RepID=UPI002577FA2D|nr:hypothetical protein [Citrobacter sp. Cf120]MDM3138713.1 hypothetical protein [Citrobacter sp. Cf120]